MNISIIDPFLLQGFDRYSGCIRYNLHGYMIEFVKRYKPNIYVSRIRDYPRLQRFFTRIGEKASDFNISRFPLSKKSLYRQTDVLLYMGGGIHRDLSVFRDFDGLKMYHIMDPQFRARELNEFLISGGIDFLFGYNSYDKHSAFVKQMYPSFENRIIGIPFGFDPAWSVVTPFEKRVGKAFLQGTMETFKSVKAEKYHDDVLDYFQYFHEQFNSMHETRYLIDRDVSRYADFIDSKIRHWPQKANFIHDIIVEFNKYKFFINDESLLNFCPIRTYEGIAAGCVMIAHAESCYEEWGFIDGENCIMFSNVEDIPSKISYYLENPEKLNVVQQNGRSFVADNYNHSAIADMLYDRIQSTYSS